MSSPIRESAVHLWLGGTINFTHRRLIKQKNMRCLQCELSKYNTALKPIT